MNTSKKLLLGFFLLLSSLLANAQNDTIHLSDGTIMIGEIKSLQRGVLTIETDCSDSDFKVESGKVETITSSQHFIIILENSEQFEGTINKTDSNYVEIIFSDSSGVLIEIDRIIELRTYDEKIKDRFSAYIDFGLDLTKANNLSQYSLRSGGSYRAKRWFLSINVNSLRSNQDDVAPIERNDGNLGVDYIMTKNWFVQTKYSWLQNNEQNLELRTITSGGLGKFLFKTSHYYWSISTGAAWVNEIFLEVEGIKEPDRESEKLISQPNSIFLIWEI
jgi:hypothetical protein